MLEKIKQIRKEVEEYIAQIIKETNFYQEYKEEVEYWYYYEFEKFLVITGAYGIGKSRTLKQILKDMKVSYHVLIGRFEHLHDLIEAVDIENLSEGDVLVFDDSFVSKRLQQTLFSLVSKGIRIIFVLNHTGELKNIDKIIYGRGYIVKLSLSSEDIKYLIHKLSEKYSITFNDIILNLRDLVNITVYKLCGGVKEPKLTIKQLEKEARKLKDRYNMLKYIIKRIIGMGIIDEELFIEIAVKVLGYQHSTAKKYVKRILHGGY